MKSYLPRFDNIFYDKLAFRKYSFRKIFEFIDQYVNPIIVETGTVRSLTNFEGDGCSTLLFDDFIKHSNKGQLVTIDINEDNLILAKDACISHRVSFVLGDSVKCLRELRSSINVLYLDSYDVNFSKDHDAAFHALKELTSAMPFLRRGSLVVVDDNNVLGRGKGRYLRSYMNDINAECVFDDYQIGWVLR